MDMMNKVKGKKEMVIQRMKAMDCQWNTKTVKGKKV